MIGDFVYDVRYRVVCVAFFTLLDEVGVLKRPRRVEHDRNVVLAAVRVHLPDVGHRCGLAASHVDVRFE